MTCIVGLVHGDAVTIGGDSAAVDGDNIAAGPTKVFERGPYLIGYCESFRTGQVLQYRAKFTEQKCDDPLEHLCTTFVDELRKALHQASAVSTDVPHELQGPLLVAYRNRLYTVDSDFAIHPAAEYAAIGAGASYALGSFCSTAGRDPETRVFAALAAASIHCTAVISPFTIRTQGA
jgi:ATP-dependent protease HslVU (ClpYQ) peptidase subunit